MALATAKRPITVDPLLQVLNQDIMSFTELFLIILRQIIINKEPFYIVIIIKYSNIYNFKLFSNMWDS